MKGRGQAWLNPFKAFSPPVCPPPSDPAPLQEVLDVHLPLGLLGPLGLVTWMTDKAPLGVWQSEVCFQTPSPSSES